MKNRAVALIGAALLSLAAISPASAITIDYSVPATTTAPSLLIDGVTVTGSADVHLLHFNGLGIVGGIADHVTDGSEYINFAFTGAGSATGVSYFISTAGNVNGNGLVGERTLDVFGIGGGLLGSFAQDNGGIFDISALVGNVAIESFRLTANVDTFRIGSLTFEPAAANVPEPASLALLGLALAGLGLARRRRQRQA